MARRTLIVTNDFPPRQGGIESFVLALAQRMPPDEVVVYTARMPGAAAFDATLPFPVHRDRARTLLPTRRVARAVERVFREHDCDAALFGAAAPLALLAPTLRRAGARRIVGMTHGHEVWWSTVPVARRAMRRIGEATDTLTYLGEYTRSRIARALTDEAAGRMVRLPPGVEPDHFRPDSGGAALRERLGIPADRPVIACIARLKPRKGQDMLIRAMPHVLRDVPDALLLVVGGGPIRSQLDRLVAQLGLQESVRLVGPVTWPELPPWFDAADVFAMPCRTRRMGLEPEALGIVFLEASATELPVVVGDSGGAPDACLPGETGVVVDGRDPAAIARAVTGLLTDRDRAAEMGRRGREWVTQEWQWDDLAARMRGLLEPR